MYRKQKVPKLIALIALPKTRVQIFNIKPNIYEYNRPTNRRHLG